MKILKKPVTIKNYNNDDPNDSYKDLKLINSIQKELEKCIKKEKEVVYQ